jgi:hypothetical protein
MPGLKTLKYFLVFTLLISQTPAFADPIEQSTTDQASGLEQNLKQLTEAVDLYYDEMISLKSTLTINGLKITSPISKMDPQVASTLQTLEETRLEIIESIRNFRPQIEAYSRTLDLASADRIHFLYDLLLVKAFLPRYDTAKINLFTRLFSSYQPQYVDELIPRAEALNLFFIEFNTYEPTRFSEIIKTHNTVTSKINQLRNANLYQVYPKSFKLENGIQEASLYQSLIRGEEFQPSTQASSNSQKETPSAIVINKVSDTHFSLTLNCSALFGI